MPECAQRWRRERGRGCASIKRREPTDLNIDMALQSQKEGVREGVIEPPKVHINNVKMLRMSVQQVGDKLTRGFYAKLCKVCSCVSVCESRCLC